MTRPRPPHRPRPPRPAAQDGIASVELGILAALLALLAVSVTPLAGALAAHHTLARATSEGLRVATKVESNPRDGADGCPDRRRADADAVTAAVRNAAGIDDLAVAIEHDAASLCDVAPGGAVAVSATHDHDLGVLAETANGLAAVFDGAPILPTTLTVEARTHGVRE